MNRRRSLSITLPTTVPLAALAAATAIAVLVAVLSALMMDDASGQMAAPATGATGSTFLGMMQGLVGLVIVLGAIFAAGWLLKKLGPRARSSGIVQVVGGVSVGPREKVVVVRFGGQTLLLGVAPGQVSLLHSADSMLDDAATTTPDTQEPRFVDRLRAARSGS
jgi:flagellar protein FliO/FliZ